MISLKKDVNPFPISIGKCIYSEVIFYNLSRERVKMSHQKIQQFNDTITIKLSSEYLRENRFYLNDKRINKIDVLLKGIFEEKLIDHLDLTCNGKGDIKDNIIKFMNRLNLTEEDIAYDSLRKIYFRHRKKRDESSNINFRSSVNTG